MVWGSLVQRLRLYEVINIEIEQPAREKGAFGARLRAFMFPGGIGAGHSQHGSWEGKYAGEGHLGKDMVENTRRVGKV